MSEDPTANVSIHNWRLAANAGRRTSFGFDEIFLQFSVLVSQSGCYAIDITIREHDSSTGNDTIGGSGRRKNRMACYCMRKGESRTFFSEGVAAGDRDHRNPIRNGATRLPPIRGRWPESDGWFDDTIEVFADIEIRQCSRGACNAAAENESCQDIDPRRFNSLLLIRNVHTNKKSVVIDDGTGWDEGVDAIGTGISAGSTLIGMAAPGARRIPRSGDMVALARRMQNLERNVASLIAINELRAEEDIESESNSSASAWEELEERERRS